MNAIANMAFLDWTDNAQISDTDPLGYWPATTSHDASIEDLIQAGESQTIEFKSTARWNVHADRQDAKLEHVIVKTVCGLLNAEGGSLLIGVDDDGNVLGLTTTS